MRKNRKRKLTAAQQMVIDQLIAAIPIEIEQLESPEAADFMEKFIYRMMQAGEISEQTYQTWLNAIKEKYKDNQWPIGPT